MTPYEQGIENGARTVMAVLGSALGTDLDVPELGAHALELCREAFEAGTEAFLSVQPTLQWCEEHKCSVIDGWVSMCAFAGLMLRDTGDQTKEPCRIVTRRLSGGT